MSAIKARAPVFGLMDILENAVASRTGSICAIQNQIGGDVTLTTTSSRLFSSMCVCDPVAQIITSACEHHMRAHGDDGGVYVGLLIAYILQKCWARDNLPANLVVDVIGKTLDEVLAFIERKSYSLETSRLCGWRHAVDSLTYKLSSLMTRREHEDLKKLILQTFISVLPDDGGGDGRRAEVERDVVIESAVGVGVGGSDVVPGLLLYMPYVSYQARRCVGELELAGSTHVICVSASMSGDSADCIQANYELRDEAHISPAGVVLEGWVSLADELVTHGVRVVACQRVIHPLLRRRLEKKGFLCLQRLGEEFFSRCLSLCGGRPVTHFEVGDLSKHVGTFHGISIVKKCDRKYIHLRSESSSIHTLFISHPHDQALEDVKVITRSTFTSLFTLLTDPRVVAGAGEIESGIAQFLDEHFKNTHVTSNVSHWQTKEAISVLVESFQKLSNAVSRGANPVDVCHSKMASIQTAMNTSAMILGIKNIISQK